MYDAFSQIDIHIEITLPGGMKLYGINSNEELINIDEEIWEKAYISSVLRAMMLEKAPCTKIYKEFKSIEEMDTFLENLLEFISKNNITIQNKDLILYKGNFVLNVVCNYLIRKRRYHHAIDFFKKAVGINIKYIVFLSEIFNSLGNHLDTIKLIAPILQKNPHIITLIFQESVSLMEIKRFDLAGRLTRYLIQIAPECFEVWMLYIEILIRCKV
jgi:tetratricopeptide (TPR) repeat protein